MVDYYKDKRECLHMINKMLSDGVPINAIYYKVKMTYGFGKKIVDDQILLFKEMK